jgi:hypothetical protein
MRNVSEPDDLPPWTGLDDDPLEFLGVGEPALGVDQELKLRRAR